MSFNALIRIPVASEKSLDTLIYALEPETRSISARTRITMKKEDRSIVLEVDAKDAIALRSAINAYLRWINSTLEVLSSLDK